MSVDDPKAEVVLVVKGAGLHKPDDTLDLFLRGFLPAVKRVDPRAVVRQIDDEAIFDDFPVSPHDDDPHLHLTEIKLNLPTSQDEGGAVEHQRIWVKEVYWENELHPISAWKAFFTEWLMASYALRRDLSLWLQTCFRRGQRKGQGGSGEEQPPRADTSRFFFKWFSYALLYFLLFSFFVISYRARFGYSLFERSFLWGGFLEGIVEPWAQLLKTLIVFFVAAILAWPISLQTTIYFHSKGRRGQLLGLPAWTMLAMLLSFLLFTSEYLGVLVIAILPIVLVMNPLRALLWHRRPAVNSDFQPTWITLPDGKSHKVFLPAVKLYYRLIVVLALPILFLILVLAKVLKWTRLLGAVGDGIESLLATMLGGILGDISSFARDPAQALRIRSVVETEIAFFASRPEVGRIHVFAHSQGTAITFETLFAQLRPELRQRIHTYVTIGSVLSYYYQTAPILESVYPPVNRFRLDTYPKFTPGFRWYNCWNLLDPITEFSGLNEYDKGTEESPRNIKTRARFHSDYWVDVEEVHVPFVNRLLGHEEADDFWARNQAPVRNPLPQNRYDLFTVGPFILAMILGILGVLRLYPTPLFDFSLWKYAGSIWRVINTSLMDFDWYVSLSGNFTGTRTYVSLVQFVAWMGTNGSTVLIWLVVVSVVVQFLRGVSIARQEREARKAA